MVHRVDFRQEHKQKLRIFCQQMVTLRSDMCEQAQYTFRRNQKCICEEPDINCSRLLPSFHQVPSESRMGAYIELH